MATATIPIRAHAQQPKFTMPVPEMGIVTWNFADATGRWTTALVTAVYPSSIDVMVFPNGTHLPQPKTGVRHRSDPHLKTMSEPNPGGMWEFAPLEQRLKDLERRLEEQVAAYRHLNGEYDEHDRSGDDDVS